MLHWIEALHWDVGCVEQIYLTLPNSKPKSSLVGEKVGTSDTGIVSNATEVLAKALFLIFPIAKNLAYLYVVAGCYLLTRSVAELHCYS